MVSSSPVLKKLAIDPANLQPSLLLLVLRVTALLGGLVYVPSVYFAMRAHFVGVAVVDTVALAGVLALLGFDGIPFRVRAGLLCSVLYVLGVGLLIGVGAISQIYLFGFSLIATLLLGQRAGLLTAALSSVTLLAIGVLGRASHEMAIPEWPSGLTHWVIITLNFAFVDTALTLAVGAMLAAVNEALRREIANGISLERERTLLRTLIDSLPDVVVMKDAEGRFVKGNPAAVALMGFQREAQLAGKTVFDVFPEELAAPYHADDLRVMASGEVLNREERSIGPQGVPFWFLTLKVPLRDESGAVNGLLGISRDITDRKKAEAERIRLLAQLQLQIERMPLAYLLSDRDFRYVRWNPAAERIFGFKEAEVLGKHPFDVIVPPSARAFVSEIFERIKSGSMDAHGESENATKGGGSVTCEWHNTPMFDEEGAFAGLLSLAQDVTGRKKLEAQLRQAQKMEAVGQLAGGVAHDFNNLLSVVLSYSDLLLADLDPSDRRRDDVEEIRRAGERAAGLTRQLLTFGRKQVIAPRVLDLNALLVGVDKMLRRLVGEDVEFVVIAGSPLGRVRADAGSIEQVVVNLVVNARDAMPTGGKLTLETGNVTLDAEFTKGHLGAKPGPYVMLSVSDTGMGMDKATQARIFEPFFTTKATGKGTGLGLATVFGIVEQSGGTLWVYSEVGIGTTFKVYLPCVDAPVESLPPGETQRPVGLGSETILVVEDEEQVREIACSVLARNGYTVLEARSAGEAILHCEQHPGQIHLLLSDVVMPQMSGPVLAKRLGPMRPAMKILFMSGYTDDASARHGVRDGEFAFLQKPLTVETLTRKVRAVLDARPGRSLGR